MIISSVPGVVLRVLRSLRRNEDELRSRRNQMSCALNEEMRRKTHGTSSHLEVLITENKGKSQKKEQNSGRDKSRSKSKSRYKNKKENKDKKGKQRERDNDDGDRVTTTTCGDLVGLRDYDTINLLSDESMWIIDSGATLHVTSRKEFCTFYTSVDFGVLKMGNDRVSKVIGVGDAHLQTNIGMRLLHRGVKHAPDVRFKVISVQVLDDGGYDNHFGSGKWKLTKGNLIVAKGDNNSKLYWTKALVAKDSVNVVYMESSLWHGRLGHISEKGLNCLAKNDVLSGLKSVELEKCSHSMTGKQTRVSFKKHPPSRKLELLEFVHYDVCGPLKFKEFHALVERQSGKKLKRIRTDNGGEYCGPFDAYCRQYGIAHEKTLPKTSQLNGLVERMNKTLIERVRCMHFEAKLPKHFWGEALLTAVHVINLRPAVALNSEVTNKIWFGKNVTYGHLRVFGCKAFFHVIKDDKSKLDDEFGYKLYDPVEKKVVRSHQTIEDIDKVEKSTPKKMQVGDDLDVPIDNVDEEEHDVSQDESLGDVPELPEAQPKRSDKPKQPSKKYSINEHVMLTDEGELECYEEATESEEKQKRLDAIQDEMKSLHDNHTYHLVKLPKGKRALENRWIFKVKQENNSTSTRCKARLVVKGFRQRKGVDFNEIFSPMVRMTSIRAVLSLDATLDLQVEQMDVMTTFVHGDLEEDIYMKQQNGFLVEGKEDYVCRLRKSLYGLKQAPRRWYKNFEYVMCEQGYKKTTSNHCVFVRKFYENDFIILLLYVDDMLIVGKDVSKIDRLKNQLGKSFSMKDMGATKKILGISITRDRKEKKLWLSQEHYIQKVLQRFQTENAKVLSTHFKLSVKQSPSSEAEKIDMSKVPYAFAVGSLMYAMVCTRLDIAHVVGDKPTLVGYSNSDMAGDIDSRKSTSGYLIQFAGGVKKFLQELSFVQGKYLLYCDSQSVIHLGKNPTFHSKSKHIDVKYHWIRDVLNAKLLELAKVQTNDNGADMMTKALPRGKFEVCCEIAGLADIST
ncbi:hypothetical protein V8G54_020552 [Vigna mungo]|uniref:Integrase catalytic domain-containing protein n=1 Tax=Vigna mungo TaxID=3915 RepID=A0AAQ3NDU9_VIGMU